MDLVRVLGSADGQRRPPAPDETSAAVLARWSAPKLEEGISGMDFTDAAAQRRMDALAAHQTLIGMSDNPTQSAQQSFSALFQQCWREKYGDDDERPLLEIPF